MTTTAATANTSASTSTPKDSPSDLHDYEEDDGASETIEPGHRRHRGQQEHNHVDRQRNNNSNKDSEGTPSPPSQDHHPDSPTDQSQSQSPDDNDVSNTTTSTTTESAKASPPPPQMAAKNPLPTTATSSTTTLTKTTSPTSTSPAPATGSDELHHEQSTSSQQQQLQQSTTNNSNSNNNTEQKRPMNAFLLFCKRQRSLVKEKYPNLENRGITKILGDWWSKLDKEQKSKYTDLARQHKEAFMKANPDFKWCKTANVSNINNNISMNITDNDGGCNNNTTPNQHHQNLQHLQRIQQNSYHSASLMKTEALSLQSTHQHHQPMDVVHHSANSTDIMLRCRKQLEAPKPPKKRFLERNDSVHATKNSGFTPNHNDTNSLGTDVVPYISLDQDFLDRVIDKAFSEDSSNSPSSANTCKFTNRIPKNSTSGNNPTPLLSSSATVYTTTTLATNNDEQPMDYSMKKTYMATSQQIINSLVENMLSEPSDNSSSFSKMNGTDSGRSQIRPPVKRDNPNDT